MSVKSMRVIKLESVRCPVCCGRCVGCELWVKDRSFVRLLKVEEGDATVRDSGCDNC